MAAPFTCNEKRNAMKFLDEAKIFIKSGDGGAGCCGFRREKFIEFGGPDGGNGGRGGDIVIEAVSNLNTLIDFRYRQHFKAQNGLPGMGSMRSGKSGKSIVLKVPVGTQVLDAEKKNILADLTREKASLLLLKGGDGGFGNTFYKSSTNQAPRRADPGWPGEEQWIWFRLKLIADVGLVGLPNAGKSTFLSVVSRAKPRIAPYPFTTLHPHLGVVLFQEKEWVVADLPGMIEGAHEGVGLGQRFLGHAERCSLLLHIIDATQENTLQAYNTIDHEIKSYNPSLAKKPAVVVLSKCDVFDDETIAQKTALLQKVVAPNPVVGISSLSKKNLNQLLAMVKKILFKD